MAESSLDSIRVPPQHIEAEQSVLGGLMLDNAAWDRIGDVLVEDDFYRLDHRLIYSAICELLANNDGADALTVGEALERRGQLGKVGGMPYLGTLVNGVPGSANIRRYAEVVRERSVLRQLAALGSELAESAFSGQTARELIDRAEERILAVSEAGDRGRQGFRSSRELLGEVMADLQALYESGDGSEVVGVRSGFIDLDRLTSGLHGGELIIVAGRPSMGKTAFAMNIAEHVALSEGLPVAVFSLEMQAAQLFRRLIGSVARVDLQRLRNGRCTNEEWDRIINAVGQLADAPLYIDDTDMLNHYEVRARARRLRRQVGPLGLIIIDYLQIMGVPASRDQNRAQDLGDITRNLKGLAKELEVPVIALSQLNRSVESRNDKRPLNSDLRESGALEQDADVILFLYRDEYYNTDSPDKGVAECIIGKQRNGPKDTVRLTFLGEHTRFENFASPQTYAYP